MPGGIILNLQTIKKLFAKLKKTKSAKALKTAGIVLAVLCVVFVAVFLSARALGNVAFSNVTDSVRMFFDSFSGGDGFPYQLENLNTVDAVALDDSTLILYKDSSVVINKAGKEINRVQLNITSPYIAVNNGRAIIYDTAVNNVYLQSRTELLGELSLDNKLLTATLGKNGVFAVATDHATAQSCLTVYDKHLQPVFSWLCVNEKIADIAISDDGKTFAVSAVGAENAKIYSRLVILDIDSDKIVKEHKFVDTFLMRVVFTDRDRIVAVGDDVIASFNTKYEMTASVSFTQGSLRLIDTDESGNTVICLASPGASRTKVIKFAANGKQSFEADVKCDASDVCVEGNKTYLMDGGIVTVLNRKGEVTETVDLENDKVREFFVSSGDIYAIFNGKINKY